MHFVGNHYENLAYKLNCVIRQMILYVNIIARTFVTSNISAYVNQEANSMHEHE